MCKDITLTDDRVLSRTSADTDVGRVMEFSIRHVMGPVMGHEKGPVMGPVIRLVMGSVMGHVM